MTPFGYHLFIYRKRDNVKEVLLVDGCGMVYTDALEDNSLRHDTMVGGLITKYLENDYQPKDSMLDNSLYAVIKHSMLVILDDVRDIIIIFPSDASDLQLDYYFENFENVGEEKRLHMMYYDRIKKKLRDITSNQKLQKIYGYERKSEKYGNAR